MGMDIDSLVRVNKDELSSSRGPLATVLPIFAFSRTPWFTPPMRLSRTRAATIMKGWNF